ncbi:MAG: hypothetical protein A2934_00555 [Candidatus Sungbacteria bacterium RIFCSPLOWO2_01_FULL_47_10]|uniref:Uncharacterized protein n=1 Tax=Candidatus Sungbacteria bacterium RIFCSPLOWO2_01_FULL_47_10 TaxID=1802276 RepID=A0A1G2L5J6_9BACT|nr:MAG: hypothetical protein A2934_00555 [Candidatus Sungbacteria bacterium RIFCSPLOWO2_01_FULL_47_10]
MDIVEESRRFERERTAEVKENFIHQLSANHACGGMTVKTLKYEAVKGRICNEYFDISDAVSELIREEKATLQFVGGDVYLWLKNCP